MIDPSLQSLLSYAGISTIVTMLCLASLTNSVLGFSPDNVIGYNESIIQVVSESQYSLPDSGEYCQAYGIGTKDLLVRDLKGNVITETTAGSQVMLETTIVNSCIDQDNALSMTLFEVRDSREITIYLTWQNNTINSKTSSITGASWVTPYVPGEYLVRSFHITCLNCTGLIHDIQEYNLTVLPRST